MTTATEAVNDTANNLGTEPMAAASQSTAQKTSRGGAPRGNSNAMRAGLRASKLPAKCKGEEREIYFLRQEVLSELVAIHGSLEAIPLLAMALLNSLVRHETRARLAARWLRMSGDG